MERRQLRIRAVLVAALALLATGCSNPLLGTIKQIVDDALAPKLPSMVLKQDVIMVPDNGFFDCGSIAQMTTRDVTFTIINAGSGDLELTNIPPVAISATDFSVTQQPSSPVLPGGSTTFVVRFLPQSTGAKTGTILVPSNDDAVGTLTVTLLGTGTVGAQPAIQVRQGGNVLPDGSGSYPFGNVLYNTSSGTVTFTIDNIGSADLHLTSVTRAGTSPTMYSNSAPPLPATVTPGSFTTFTVTFSPTTTGSLAASVQVACDDPDKPTYTFAVTGTGTAPEMNVKQSSSIASGGSYDFGARKVGVATDITFTIENTSPGNGNLVLSGPTKVVVGGTHAGMFVVTSQPTSPVAAGGSTTFTVRFTPSSEGLKTASLTIENNDQNENPYTVNVSGSGTVAAYVSPSGSSGNSGLLPTAPKATIADGISVAQANGLSEVRIAQGTYSISATINVVAGISLKGGYSADFSSRSYSNVSKISLASFIIGLTADGAGITRATAIDGLTVEAASLGGYGAYLANGASPTFSNNTVTIIDTVADTAYLVGIHIDYTGGDVGNPLITGNTITLYHPNVTVDDRTRAGYVYAAGSGSDVVIERNVISAQSGTRTDGVRIASSTGVTVKNNVVSTKCSGSGYSMAVIADLSNVVISNNTVSSHSVSGSQYGFYGGSSTTAKVVNNIFCTPRNYGTGIYINGTATVSYGWNLLFYFVTSVSGTGTDLTNNGFYPTDIFTSVFTGARDTDLSNGDSSNYHLSDSGTYAYNLGTNTNTAAYGYVANDIDGEARPKGASFDKGADEK
jgi:hypothetical protein